MKLNQKSEGILTFIEYRKPRFRLGYALILLALFLSVCVAILPVVWLILASFKDAGEVFSSPFTFFPREIRLQKIGEVWSGLNFGRYYLNTVLMALGAVAAVTIFCGLLAYAVSILRPAGHKIVFGLILLSYMVPAVASIVPLYSRILSLKLTGYLQYLPLCLIYGANAYYFMMFKGYFDGLPRSLFEAAEIDGSGKMRMFFSIVLPLSKPIVGVVAIFTVTAAWSDFLLPYLILQDDRTATLMVKVFNLQSAMATMMNFGVDKLLMTLTLSILPQIALFAVFQKQIMGVTANSGIKG